MGLYMINIMRISQASLGKGVAHSRACCHYWDTDLNSVVSGDRRQNSHNSAMTKNEAETSDTHFEPQAGRKQMQVDL